MQANTFAYQARRQIQALYQLAQAVDHGHHDQRVDQTATGKFQQARKGGQHQPHAKAQVGHRNRQAREDANRQGQVQPKQGQTHAVRHGQNHHHQQLAAQVLAQHVVRLGQKTVHTLAQPWGHQVAHLAHKTVPVHQQIKQRHGNQDGVADDGKGHAATQLDRGQHRTQRVFHIGVEVLHDKILDAAHIQRHADTPLRQPGFDRGVQAVQQHRKLLSHQRQLFGKDGNNEQQHAEQHHHKQQLHHHHGSQARNPAPPHIVQPVHHWGQRIGQHCRHHKGGQHRGQQPQREHHQARNQQPGSESFLGGGELHRRR